MRFAPRTIVGQLITGSVIVQSIVFGVFLFIGVRRDSRETQEYNRQRLMRQARTMAAVLDIPLSTGNEDMLDHIVRSIPTSTTIGVVRITDAKGNMLRSSNAATAHDLSPRERDLLPELNRRPEYHLLHDINGADEAVQPVIVNGFVCGVVWITPDESATHHHLPIMALRNLAGQFQCHGQ